MAKSNAQYWNDRQMQTFMEGEKLALDLSKTLKENYDKSIANIDKDIEAFYGKFATEQGITIAEAKRLLDKKELKNFSLQLQEYIEYAKEHDFDDGYIKELNLLKYKTKVSRLEELKTHIKFQLAKLNKVNYDIIAKEMLDLYDFGYLHEMFEISKQLGMSISFARPAIKLIEKYLSQSIDIGNYAIGENQIWANKIPKLMNILNIKIPQGIILGQNPKKVAKSITDPIEKDFNNIVRVVRTEYNYIFNQAACDSIKECNIGRYQILATLDERTCSSCGPLDLLVVYMKDKQVGVNCPPFHPNCRCVIKAYFDPDEFDINNERIAKDKDGKPYMVPANLTYDEWKSGLTIHKGGVKYWKPKGA